jgi:hypothetical protein
LSRRVALSPGALGLTFRREDGRLRLVAVEAPDRKLLAGL